jgi:hypothetical protein
VRIVGYVDDRRAVGANGQCDDTRDRSAAQHYRITTSATHRMRINKWARCAGAQLTMAEGSFDSNGNTQVGRSAILEGKRVDGARGICVAAIWCKDRRAHYKGAERSRESREPAEGALPRNRRG